MPRSFLSVLNTSLLKAAAVPDTASNVQRTVLEAAALALEAHRNALRVVRAVEIAAADLAELHVDQLAFVHHAFIRHVKDRGLDKHLRHRIGAETAVGRAEATVHLDDLPIVNLDAVNDLLRTRKVMRPLEPLS